MLTFMMLDANGNGKVDLKSYRYFWQQYIYMYGLILHQAYTYDNASEELTQQTFWHIVKSKNSITEKQYFDLEDFTTAKERSPQMFEWIS